MAYLGLQKVREILYNHILGVTDVLPGSTWDVPLTLMIVFQELKGLISGRVKIVFITIKALSAIRPVWTLDTQQAHQTGRAITQWSNVLIQHIFVL